MSVARLFFAFSIGFAGLCQSASAADDAAANTVHVEFLSDRASLVMNNQPDPARRISRLGPGMVEGDASISTFMNALPAFMGGAPVNLSASLAGVDAIGGAQKQGKADAWISGLFALGSSDPDNTDFSQATFGADYRVDQNLLIGGTLQFDQLRRAIDDSGTATGAGWLAGPYLTARLADDLYVDLVAQGGTGSNSVSLYGPGHDDFRATRFLTSASIQGDAHFDEWTFSPRARFSYFEETSHPYSGDLKPLTAGRGQLSFGPALSYKFVTSGKVTINTSLRFDSVTDVARKGDWNIDNITGRVQAGSGFDFTGGGHVDVSAAFDGVGSTQHVTSSQLTVSLPLR